MKNSYSKYPVIKSIILVLTLIVFVSCNDETCDYDVPCVENAPEGFMVTTKASMTSSNIVGTIFETTNNSFAPLGANWNDTGLGTGQVQNIQPNFWDVTRIGQVFGIAIKGSDKIFLSATDVYNLDSPWFPSTFGTAGRSGIYITDINTPNTTNNFVGTLVSSNANTVGTAFIPNSGTGSGNSIGNIAYDKVNDQLFATNLEDGRIYRIDATTGNVKSIFDPFTIDTGLPGIAAIGEQIWGIGVFTSNGKTTVYFARSNTNKEIWSIDLNANGEFTANEIGITKLFDDSSSSSKLEIANIPGTQAKITDIAFSCKGKMLIAERGAAHSSQMFEYVKPSTTWVTGNSFYVGGFSGQNAAGGVDYGSREKSGAFISDDIVWASGNYMQTSTSSLVYGVQGMSSSGNSATVSNNSNTDIYIDLDNSTNEKGGLGDVEIFDSNCPCNN